MDGRDSALKDLLRDHYPAPAGIREPWVIAPLGVVPEAPGDLRSVRWRRIIRGMRERIDFRASGRVQVLRSTAAPIIDDWTRGANFPKKVPGGGIQYFVVDNRVFVVYLGNY